MSNKNILNEEQQKVVDKFFKQLESKDETCIYKTFFKLLKDSTIFFLIRNIYHDYVECNKTSPNYAWWFSNFHKLIRQIDFFSGDFEYIKRWRVDTGTDADRKRFNEIVNQRNQYYKDNAETTVRFWTINKELYKEYVDLIDILRKEETESIGGVLDSLLWQTIANDNNALYYTFVSFFEDCISSNDIKALTEFEYNEEF